MRQRLSAASLLRDIRECLWYTNPLKRVSLRAPRAADPTRLCDQPLTNVQGRKQVAYILPSAHKDVVPTGCESGREVSSRVIHCTLNNVMFSL